jgi:hypothetical protein
MVQTAAVDEGTRLQLEALAEVGALLDREGIDHWLFGGWAVDFYAGAVTRPHFDVDFHVWLADVPRITALLGETGWSHAPEPDEDGGTGYERGGVRVELTFLDRDGETVFIPLRTGRAVLRQGALADDVRRLDGIDARVIGLDALRQSKSGVRDDPEDAAKDRADLRALEGVPG